MVRVLFLDFQMFPILNCKLQDLEKIQEIFESRHSDEIGGFKGINLVTLGNRCAKLKTNLQAKKLRISRRVQTKSLEIRTNFLKKNHALQYLSNKIFTRVSSFLQEH